MTDQEEQALMNAVIAEVGARLGKAKTNLEAADIAGAYALVGYKMMRAAGGNEFTRGWLESALHDVKTTEPEMVWSPLQ